MKEQKRKTILEMIQYALLMMIFTSILIGTCILWEERTVEKNEAAVISTEDAKKLKRVQLYKPKEESVIFDGEDVYIGGR